MIAWLMLLLSLGLVAVAQGRSPHAADHKAPTITITAPTTASTYATTATPLTVSGTASDNVGVTRVTWQNAAGSSGTATGTTIWSASVPLAPGANLLTITAFDAAGHTATDTLTVTLMAQSGPVTIEWRYTGTAGDAFQLERCTVVLTCPCSDMQPMSTPAITARSWTDTSVSPTDDYAYRMAVITGGTLGPYSNTMCSP